MFVFWRSTTEVKSKSAWKIRKWEDPTGKAAAALRQSVTGWIGVCLLLGSGWGEALVWPRPGSVREWTTDRLCSWTRSDTGLIPREFLLTAYVIWLCLCLNRGKLAVRFAGLVCSAPSDEVPLCAPTTQTSPDPVWYLSRIFPTGEYTWKNIKCPEEGRKGRWIKGFLSSRRLSAVAAPWRDTWFPLSKRRSSFVNGFWIFSFLGKASSHSAWLSSF